MTMYGREAEKVLELARARGESAEVWSVDSERIPVRFQDSKLKMLEASSSTGIALRIVVDGKLGFAASTREGAAEELVEKACATAQFGSQVDFEFPAPGEYPDPEILDPAVAELDADSMTETGLGIVRKISEYDPDVKVNLSVSRGTGRIRLLNTSGIDLQKESTSASVSCHAVLVEDGILHVGDVLGSRFLYDDPMQVADRVIEQLVIGRKKASITDGRYPVIFSPWAMNDILRPFLACADGDSVSRGVSPWRERIGDTVADGRVSIYDDGLMRAGLGTSPWDDEGVPGQCTPIVEDGVLRNFLLDLRNSARLDMPPTGNGGRGGLTSVPGVSTSNLRVEPGDVRYREMLASVDEGILVHQLMGAWGANPYGGEVSGNVSLGFKIENGEAVGRVKDCMLHLNAFEAWSSRLISISSDVMQALSFRYPYVLMDGVSISTRG